MQWLRLTELSLSPFPSPPAASTAYKGGLEIAAKLAATIGQLAFLPSHQLIKSPKLKILGDKF